MNEECDLHLMFILSESTTKIMGILRMLSVSRYLVAFFFNGGQNIWVIPQARATNYIVLYAEALGSFILNMVAGQRLKFFLP